MFWKGSLTLVTTKWHINYKFFYVNEIPKWCAIIVLLFTYDQIANAMIWQYLCLISQTKSRNSWAIHIACIEDKLPQWKFCYSLRKLSSWILHTEVVKNIVFWQHLLKIATGDNANLCSTQLSHMIFGIATSTLEQRTGTHQDFRKALSKILNEAKFTK